MRVWTYVSCWKRQKPKTRQDTPPVATRATMRREYADIVVGSSLRALLFAFTHRLPIVYSEAQRPFRFDYFEPAVDLSCLKISQESKTLTTHTGVKTIGTAKEILWERLMFLLSVEGLDPVSNLCHSIRHKEGSLICSDEYSKIAEISFDKCHYFGDQNAHGLVKEKTLDPLNYICYDWIAFNRGGKHSIDHLQFDEDIVNQVWFYPSDRIDGATKVKDACVVSKMTSEQIAHFDNSQTMVRFKLLHLMESIGMKGKFNGYGSNGNPKYYKFRTSSIARSRRECRNTPKPQAGNITLPQDSEEDLLKGLPQSCLGYNRLLRHL